uniref:N-acetyltransferase domain-containing protein n=1 Tax=Oryza glumipatula TaxID=40148 RepID=A0A0D9Z3N3_9ORYZ
MMRDEEEEEGVVIIIREYDPSRDRAGTEAVDRECDVGPTGGISLHADLLGDPVARIRHSPDYLMLVAETTSGATGGRIIVGIIRGTVKSVATGKSCPGAPAVASVGYILGLRVAPSHRRMGLALRMVRRMEAWFERMGAEYAYMATDKSNEASLRLFTVRCGYSKFRTPSLLVHPVHAHRRRVPRRAAVFRLGASDAERLYDGRFAHVEFFPADIGAVLGNQLSIGTFLAVIDDDGRWRHGEWRGAERFLASPPAWMRVPSVPDFFRPFSGWFVYGLGGDGPDAAVAAEALFATFVNMARGRAAAVAVEVAACDPLRRRIPHWRRLSCTEDLWCMKRLGRVGESDGWDWARSPPGLSIFVDPREV